jgi:coproporphyrinogen III oxidase-like Fe-S oxidoreductase
MKSKRTPKVDKKIRKLANASTSTPTFNYQTKDKGNNNEGIEKEAEPIKELNEVPLCLTKTLYIDFISKYTWLVVKNNLLDALFGRM